MPTATGVTAATARGEFLVVEAVLPRLAPEPIGVLLLEPAAARLGLRLRRDWDQWLGPDEEELFQALAEDWERRIAAGGPDAFLREAEESFSNTIRLSPRESTLVDRFDRTLDRLYRRHVAARTQPFQTHLPVYTCRAAAGRWGEQMEVEPEGWREIPPGARLTEDMFIAQVTGRSMEPEIADGSWCVFRAGVTGSRQGRRVLVENLNESESGGERYTIKRYRSVKSAAPADEDAAASWQHTRILLEPLNPEFESWEITEFDRCRVLAEFVRVLED